MYFPPLSYDEWRIPFLWTLVSIIITWGGVAIMYSDIFGWQVFLSVAFALEGIVFSIAVIIYLFRSIIHRNYNISKRTPLGDVLGLLDAWMALLTSQAAILYISYIYWPKTSFSVDLSLSSGGPYFVFLQIIYIMANNFHGSTSSGIFPVTAFPYVILFICSIVSRLFLFFVLPIILRAVSLNQNNNKKIQRI